SPSLSMFRLKAILACTLGSAILLFAPVSSAQSSPNPAVPERASPEKVIIDTDIGDDIDDAFAVALALRGPELQILGITTTFGDTETRAKLLDRLLGETGHSDIPVGIGIHTQTSSFTQRAYAEAGHFAR